MKKKYRVRKQYAPYLNRFNNHPYALPVTVFLVLFCGSIASFIGFNSQAVPASDSHIIELSVDGKRQSVPTRAQTVGEFLLRAEVKLEKNDIVEPSTETRIYEERFHINIYRARPVTVIEKGGKRTFAYSAATTPRSVAKQAGVEVYPEDIVEREVPESFLREGVLGEKIIIEHATPADINLYGSHLSVRTHAKTVRDLLAEKNIKLAKKDSVKPKLDTRVTEHLQVFVFRSGRQIKSVNEDIPMPLEYVEDRSLTFGTEAIRQAGSPGKRVVTYEIILRNGREIARRKIQEVVVRPPVKQIVARGPQGSFGQALAKLRQCEAGGNYKTNTGNGYYGAYQYDVSTWNNYFGYRLPSDAPPAIQDQKATETYRGRGWSPWPGCTASLGLQDIYR